MKMETRIRNEALTNNSTTQPLSRSTSDGVAIRVDHVSKKFCRYLRKSMLYGMHDIGRNLVGMSTKPDKLRKAEFWAVNDVSFELKKGECLGIIGPNGSGKSTILKMLNGIYMPDKGKIEINGRMGALIELGAGFHPLLTGRENIYVNGAILGISKEELEAKFDDIVKFADIGDFIDTPVKNYSSGMFVRLGFAIAAHCEPDILLIDEVLAVGDLSFQKKCYDRLDKLINSGIATIVVSHRMEVLRRLATNALAFLGNGECFYGDPDEAILKYYESVDSINGTSNISGLYHRDGNGMVFVEDLKILNDDMQPIETIEVGNPINFSLLICSKLKRKDKMPFIALSFRNPHTAENIVNVQPPLKVMNDVAIEQKLTLKCRIDELNIQPGEYDILIKIGGDGNYLYDVVVSQRALKVIGTTEVFDMTGFKGNVFLRNRWNLDNPGFNKDE